jgi:hypothetical protein
MPRLFVSKPLFIRVIRSIFMGVCLAICTLNLMAQTEKESMILRGQVVDAKTNEALPAAAVYVDGSFRGTVTNADGFFQLELTELPVLIKTQYMGYKSAAIKIEKYPTTSIRIELEADSFELEEITITGEDPAVRIMREVISRKKIWQEGLKTYKAEGYNRSTLANDTSIALITETVTQLFWDKEKGPREIIKSKRQTSNFMSSANMGGLRYIPNFYDDILDISEFDIFTPTHPDALSNYTFKLIEQSSLNGQLVYKIQVSPKRPLQPLFEGYVWVLDEVFAMIKIDLTPNDVVRFPAPIKEMSMAYQQQFSNFGSDFWLPLDFRSEGRLKIKMVGLEFPLFKFSQSARITAYEVNVALPDSLYGEKRRSVIVDSTTIAQPDSVYFDKIDTIPLTESESVAYTQLDSSKSISNAFKPKGFLAKQFDIKVEVDGETATDSALAANQKPFKKFIKRFTPAADFNRVDGFFVGSSFRIDPAKQIDLSVNGGYSFALEKASFGGKLAVQPIAKNNRFSINSSFQRATVTQYNNYFTPPFNNAIYVLLGARDYNNWYRADIAKIGGSYRIKRFGEASLDFLIEDGRSVELNTEYDIVGSAISQPYNPAIYDGKIQSLKASWKIGEGPQTMHVVPENGAQFSVEWSASALGSDFDFTRLEFQFNRSIPTFLKRRFLPNKLDIIGFAAIALGDELPQRGSILETSQAEFTQFGAFRTYIGRPMIGTKAAWLHAEHNFQTAFYEALGLNFLVKKDYGFLIFAGSGVVGGQDFSNNGLFFTQDFARAEERNGTEWIHEAGFSINKVFGIMRVNAGWSIPTGEFVPSFSVAKFF